MCELFRPNGWCYSCEVYDLPPEAPSFIMRVCGFGFHILHRHFGQARRVRNSATFSAFLNWITDLHIARNVGELEKIDFASLPFNLPDAPDSFASWRSTELDNRVFQSPELKPRSLMGALLYLWLFGAQRLSKFRQCRRHQIVGRTLTSENMSRDQLDETRCSVWFYPTRDDKLTCGRWCSDWMKNYNRKQKTKEK